MPSVLKSKTMLFAMLLAIFGALQASQTSLIPFMSQEVYGIFTILISIIVALLRIVTTMPLENK